MFVFYNPTTLRVDHIVIHAPEGYRETIQGHHWIETDEDIPPEEIQITEDKKIIRAKKEQPKARPAVIDLIIMKGQADKQIDAKAFVGIEPFLLAQKYVWATSNPVANAVKIEAEMRGLSLSQMVDRITGDYWAASLVLQKAELNRVKARLAIQVAPDENTVQHILNTFDPSADIDGLEDRVD